MEKIDTVQALTKLRTPVPYATKLSDDNNTHEEKRYTNTVISKWFRFHPYTYSSEQQAAPSHSGKR